MEKLNTGSARYSLKTEKGKIVAITCNTCNMTSYHPKDIEHKYCGNCHVFHDIEELKEHVEANATKAI